ncbi:MAG: NAD-dependent epimerase/dehydratase family protein [Rhabdochlamydiaceae bacterium]|nr:NAD-dependent epimerase/dehydratase family protein [Rhabdochlamydiaceae bacterium]
MKIAITGASGHIGNVLCRELLKLGHKVRALVHSDNVEHSHSIEDLSLERIHGDILNSDSLIEFCAGSDVVFHLAAKISIDGDPDGSLLRTNVEGTENVIKACLATNVKRLIHFSSIHAYKQAPFNEELSEKGDFVDSDDSCYNYYKALGEKSVQKGVEAGLDAVILSPTGVLGPFDYQPSFMGKALLDLYNGKLPALVHGGFDWVDVRDVVSSAICAMEKGRKGERYLLSGRWMSVRDLMELFAEITEKQAPKFTSPVWLAKAGLPFIRLHGKLIKKPPLYTKEAMDTLLYSNSHITARKAEQELGHSSRSMEEILRDEFTWFKERNFIK